MNSTTVKSVALGCGDPRNTAALLRSYHRSIYTEDALIERQANVLVTYNRADVWGDSREEVALFGSRGCCI